MPKFRAKNWVMMLTAFGFAASLSIVNVSAAPATAGKPAPKKIVKPAAKPKITLSSPANTTVAIVNGEKITKQQLEQATWERYAIPTLTDLIDKVAIAQAAKKSGVKVTEADIQAKMVDFKTKLPPGMTFSQFLEQWNLTEAQLRRELMTNIYVEKASMKGIKVTPQDLSGYVKARHILIATKGETPEEKTKSEAEGKAKIEQLAADIKAGKITFADAAKQNSDDPGSKEKGGELGFIRRGQMVQEFEKAAFELKPAQLSEPVKTTYGWHLIEVQALGKDATPAEKKDLTEKIQTERMRPEMTAWYLRVKQDAKVTRYLGEQPKPPAPAGMAAPPKAAPAPRVAPKPPAPGGTKPANGATPPSPPPSTNEAPPAPPE